MGVLCVPVAVAGGQHCLSLSWVPRLGSALSNHFLCRKGSSVAADQQSVCPVNIYKKNNDDISLF